MENFNDNIQLFVIKAIEMFYLKQIIRHFIFCSLMLCLK